MLFRSHITILVLLFLPPLLRSDSLCQNILSQIRILQDKIHKVINDICDINKRPRSNKTKIHSYKANPNISHNSGRTLLVGENHHPELDSLTFGEGPKDPSPDPSTSAVCVMKFNFLDSFLAFTILPFSYWTYYSDLFPMDYLSYSYFAH